MGYTAVIDYGVGNLKSVTNAMGFLGLKTLITCDQHEIARADAILLPGVGAFPDAAEKLFGLGLDHILRAEAEQKPVLGICLGMQLLFDESDEVRPCKGLGLVPGKVSRIETAQKLPHIGWNSLRLQNDAPIFAHLPQESYVYFVHSYCGCTARESDVTARTEYGTSVVAAVRHGNVYGCQFHPEKSGDVGLQILKDFGALNR
ncbi:MAG: imidazole glycerol phosphate synthase subunit HisH [Oscillospiraceae bacterium]|nr:imidazole glycerol phosphate synthase subunit HisH [Oscillospiraceae bacterium]